MSSAPSTADGVSHVVLFQLADHAERSVNALIELLEDLLNNNDLISSWSLQRDLGLRPGHHRTFHLMICVNFTSQRDFERYVMSVRHAEFLERTHQPLGATIASIQVVGSPVSTQPHQEDVP